MGVTYVRILNESSNSNKWKKKIEEETKQLNAFYGFDTDNIYDTITASDKKETALTRNLLRQSKRYLKNLLNLNTAKNKNVRETHSAIRIGFNEAQEASLQWLEEINKRENNFLNQ